MGLDEEIDPAEAVEVETADDRETGSADADPARAKRRPVPHAVINNRELKSREAGSFECGDGRMNFKLILGRK